VRPSRWTTLLKSLLMFGTGLFARVGYVLYAGIPSQSGGDMAGYMQLARNVAAGRGFSFDGVTPATYRPPLFSWLLAGWCAALGSTSLETMVAFQICVQSLCAPATYLLVRSAESSEGFAVAAGIFVAIYPFIFTNVGLILQEPTQMLITAVLGLAVIAWYRQPRAWRAAAVGLLAGLGALAKAPFLLLATILVLVWVSAPGFRRRLPFAQVVLACAIAALVVLPWTWRNYRVTGGRWVPINSQNLTIPIWWVWDGNYVIRETPSDPVVDSPTLVPGVLLTYGNPDGIEYLKRANDALLAAGATEPAITEGLAAASRSYLLHHPGYALSTVLRGMVLNFSPDAGPDYVRLVWLRIAAMLLIHLPLAAGLLAGLVRSVRERNAAFCVLSVFTIAYLVVHAPVTDSGGRYCVPMIPLLIAITGYAFFPSPTPAARAESDS
jgi:4-amino-4-deoxy-L-arabinose transferase-like glycosyltransferase